MIARSTLKVTQGGNDTITADSFSLPYTGEKVGIKVIGMEWSWRNAASMAAVDSSLDVMIATTSAATDIDQDEVMLYGGYQMVAGAFSGYGSGTQQSIVDRITVQPFVYGIVKSAATAQANIVVFNLYYEIVKLTEIEYYRLLAVAA